MRSRPKPQKGPARLRRERVRTWRSLAGLAALAAPTALMLAGDVWRRHALISRFQSLRLNAYVASAATSLGFWLLLGFAASPRKGRARQGFAAAFVLLYGLQTGVQSAFFSIFHTYDSVDGELYSVSYWRTLLGSLPLGRPVLLVSVLLAGVGSVMMVHATRAWVRPRRRARRVVSALATLALLALPFAISSYRPVQAATPDLLYFHALQASFKQQLGLTGVNVGTRPQMRRPLPIPSLKPTGAPRNVLVIFQESQRADATCIEYDPACLRATRASNRAAPERIPFLRWHTLDSSTILSSVVLWTGRLPSDPLEELETAPSIFGFAHAAGFDTAYFTSQQIMFKNMRQQTQNEPIAHYAAADAIALEPDWDTGATDAALTDYVIDHLAELRQPFFAVVQYSNQHQPYLVDPRQSPFTTDDPAAVKGFERQRALYMNAAYLSDLAVGRLVEHVKRSSAAANTVVVYTADHGESLGEHGRLGHTDSMFESQIHVPTWVDAPEAALTEAEHAALTEGKDAWLTHADLVPTFLDLLALWDAPGLAPFRAKMIGTPITRPRVGAPPAIPLTNDSWIWESVDRNWGYLRGPWKLFGMDNSPRYFCFNLENDPGEDHELGAAGCGELSALTHALFPDPDKSRRPYHPLR